MDPTGAFAWQCAHRSCPPHLGPRATPMVLQWWYWWLVCFWCYFFRSQPHLWIKNPCLWKVGSTWRLTFKSMGTSSLTTLDTYAKLEPLPRTWEKKKKKTKKQKQKEATAGIEPGSFREGPKTITVFAIAIEPCITRKKNAQSSYVCCNRLAEARCPII